MTDLTGGWFASWRDLIDAGLTGCTCRVVGLTLYRDEHGHVDGADYNHTDQTCPGVAAAIAAAVEDATRPPDDPGTPRH